LANNGRPAIGGWRGDRTDPDRIDPVGGILGALVFHAVSASTSRGPGSQFAQFLVSVGAGLAGGVAGTALLWLLLRNIRLGKVLGTSAQLAAVVAVAAGCDALRDDSGLMREFDIPARRPFFETLVQLIIGVLFISISATVTPQSLRQLVLPTLVLVAALVVVARPVAAFAATLRTDLAKGERVFIGWMAQRGIVAAATASTFTAGLVAKGIGEPARGHGSNRHDCPERFREGPEPTAAEPAAGCAPASGPATGGGSAAVAGAAAGLGVNLAEMT
jgi:NhaP-type Na+/H+ or K+/H+ antiporter